MTRLAWADQRGGASRRLAVFIVALIGLSACSGDVGSSTDPATADTCRALAQVAINQLQDYLESAVGDQSYESFLDSYERDDGAAFNDATEAYSQSSASLDDRRIELGCGEGFQQLLCDGLQNLETRGSAADELLAPSRAACG